MKRTEKLPGRASPKERPAHKHIHEFVLKTGGGKGVENRRNDVDEFFELEKAQGDEDDAHTRPNQVAPSQVPADYQGVACGKFFWKDGATDRTPPAEYIITKLGTPNSNVHLLKYIFVCACVRVCVCARTHTCARDTQAHMRDTQAHMCARESGTQLCVRVCVCVCVRLRHS